MLCGMGVSPVISLDSRAGPHATKNSNVVGVRAKIAPKSYSLTAKACIIFNQD